MKMRLIIGHSFINIIYSINFFGSEQVNTTRNIFQCSTIYVTYSNFDRTGNLLADYIHVVRRSRFGDGSSAG